MFTNHVSYHLYNYYYFFYHLTGDREIDERVVEDKYPSQTPYPTYSIP